MNTYDPRRQFIEGLDRYLSGIETDVGLAQLATNVARITTDCRRMPLA
jgi:hypothetical protein